jgi:hypothetical protein
MALWYLLPLVNPASWLPTRQPSEEQAISAEINAVDAELRQLASQLKELPQRRKTLDEEQKADRARLQQNNGSPEASRTSDVARKAIAFFIAARDNELAELADYEEQVLRRMGALQQRLVLLRARQARTGGARDVFSTEAGRSPDKASDGTTASARAAIALQLRLLRQGKIGELKACFTENLRSEITPEAVKWGARKHQPFTPEELAHEVRQGPNLSTCIVVDARGRVLTTLARDGDGWLATSLWFR